MYQNQRAATNWAVTLLERGNAVMLQPNRLSTALWVDIVRPQDLDIIETGTRAGNWDDWDEWLWQYGNDHDCPKQRFLDDPITQYYGVGGEFVGDIPCPVCDTPEYQSGLAPEPGPRYNY